MIAAITTENENRVVRVIKTNSALRPVEIRKAHRELTNQIAQEKGIETYDASNEAWPILFNRFLKKL